MVRENQSTPEGRELGAQLARFCDQEAAKHGRDGRCSTCAFRAGDHLANGSPETLMSALKCVMEREPFWCHQADAPCAGWTLMRSDTDKAVAVEWDHISGFDDPDETSPLHTAEGQGRDADAHPSTPGIRPTASTEAIK